MSPGEPIHVASTPIESASAGPLLSASVFDRATERRTDKEWLERAWARAKVLRVSAGSTAPVVSIDGRPRLVLADSSSAELGERWFLGVHDEIPYFAVVADDPGAGWAGLRQIGADGDALDLDLLVTAIALTQWHLRHHRCPRCGAETVIDQAGWTRRCPVDDSEHFPRTDPAVIMLVHDGAGRCLLGRGSAWGAGRFSTLAGFVEPGESLEAAVAREVFEEVGVTVSDVRYVASQPWPFPSSLMLGFSALALGGAQLHPDHVEMAEAGWFTRDEVRRAASWTDAPDSAAAMSTGGSADASAMLQAISPPLSISRYLIDRWLDEG